jgi:hypothetical protein
MRYPPQTSAYAGGITKGYWLIQNRQKVFVGLMVASVVGLGAVLYFATRRR